jgi:phosphoribosylformimino-5-aminoimidazole carboxamide ribotide isomerase
MNIIPAIDLSEGKVVRLKRGAIGDKTIYSNDPIEFASRWTDEGATSLHVVDLDGALAGASRNLDAVEAIVAATNVPIELGGGLRTVEDVKRVLDLGVQWAIIGTAALNDPPAVAAAISEFPERIIIGIDARDGNVAVAGWVEDSQVNAIDLAVEMQSIGAAKIIFTDIATDGMMQGPNVASTMAVAEAVEIPVIASGGVTTLADVEAICKIASSGVTAMIIGRALYEGTIALPEAIAAARRSPA